MAALIESLESRTLFAADPALLALQAESKVLIAEAVAYKKGVAADLKLVQADLRAAGETRSSAVVFRVLNSDARKDVALTGRDISKTVALIKRDVVKGIAVVKQLARKPGNPTLESKLAADIAILQTDASTRQATIAADLQTETTTETTDLAAMVTLDSTNTALATDANSTIPTNDAAAQAAITADANTALVTDVAAVVAEA